MDEFRRQLRARSYLFALVLTVGLLIANIIALPAFGAPHNWTANLSLFAPFMLVACASTPAVISGGGGLDISIGPLATCISIFIVAKLLPSSTFHSPFLAVPIALLFGAGVGFTNGFLVAVLRFEPVIATLCMLFVLTGVALEITPEAGGAPAGNWTTALTGHTLGVVGPLLLIAAPIVVWWALGRTPLLRHLYGVGANDAAAFSAGVNVTAVRIFAYTLGGVFAGVAGIALAAILQAADATLIGSYTLIAIAAVVLGGTAIGGGRGGLLNSILGASTIFLLQNFLTSIHVSANWQQPAYGAMLLAGVILGSLALRQRPPKARAAA